MPRLDSCYYEYELLVTRMHSSRMRTARLRIVSVWGGGGVVTWCHPGGEGGVVTWSHPGGGRCCDQVPCPGPGGGGVVTWSHPGGGAGVVTWSHPGGGGVVTWSHPGGGGEVL